MTIRDIEETHRDFLTLDEVASVLGGSAQSIRAVAVSKGIHELGYPATWSSEHTIRVPKAGFLNWYYHNVMGVKGYGKDHQPDN